MFYVSYDYIVDNTSLMPVFDIIVFNYRSHKFNIDYELRADSNGSRDLTLKIFETFIKPLFYFFNF